MHPAATSAELTVVIPCYNERGNVAQMVARLDAALAGVAWEAVFVDDDSPDGTAEAARHIAATDTRVRCIRRIGRRGLASAVIEGALSSSAAYIAVIDGDLQHDETRLPVMLAVLRGGTADIVVASRFAAGGDAAGAGWRVAASLIRHRHSNGAMDVGRSADGPDERFLYRLAAPVRAHRVSADRAGL